MSKLDELREEVGLKMGYAMAGALIDAAQDEVWELLEKVLRYASGDYTAVLSVIPKSTVSPEVFCVYVPDCVDYPGKLTAKEAVLAAAKELGIEEEK